MNHNKYLDLFLEGKLVATPAVEHQVEYFWGVPNNLLDIIRELDIGYGLRSDKISEFVSGMVVILGFIKGNKAHYDNMNIVIDSDIKKFAEFVHYNSKFFNSEKAPDVPTIENIIRSHLPEKYQQDLYLFPDNPE